MSALFGGQPLTYRSVRLALSMQIPTVTTSFSFGAFGYGSVSGQDGDPGQVHHLIRIPHVDQGTHHSVAASGASDRPVDELKAFHLDRIVLHGPHEPPAVIFQPFAQDLDPGRVHNPDAPLGRLDREARFLGLKADQPGADVESTATRSLPASTRFISTGFPNTGPSPSMQVMASTTASFGLIVSSRSMQPSKRPS